MKHLDPYKDKFKKSLLDDKFDQEEFYTKITPSKFWEVTKGILKFNNDEMDIIEDLCYYNDNIHLLRMSPLFNFITIVSPTRGYKDESFKLKYLTKIYKLSDDYYTIEDLCVDDYNLPVTYDKNLDREVSSIYYHRNNWDQFRGSENKDFNKKIYNRIVYASCDKNNVKFRNYYLLDQFDAIPQFFINKDVI